MDASTRDAIPAPAAHGEGEWAIGEPGRRMGANEAAFREINEQIEQLNHHLAAAGETTIQIVCECGTLSCATMLPVPIAQYQRVRSDARLFIVIAGHEDPDIDDVVDADGGTFNVVRKHAGEAGGTGRRRRPPGC